MEGQLQEQFRTRHRCPPIAPPGDLEWQKGRSGRLRAWCELIREAVENFLTVGHQLLGKRKRGVHMPICWQRHNQRAGHKGVNKLLLVRVYPLLAFVSILSQGYNRAYAF